MWLFIDVAFNPRLNHETNIKIVNGPHGTVVTVATAIIIQMYIIIIEPQNETSN